MPKSQNLQPKKFLAVAQTSDELQWFYKQTKERTNVEYYILLVGDAFTEHCLSKNNVRQNVNFLFLHNLDIDNEEVWRQFHEVKDEFNADTGRNIEEQLHLVSQIYFRMCFSDVAYMQTAIEAVIRDVEPDEVIIPPVSKGKTDDEFYVGNFQNVFFEAVRNKNIKCRIPFSSRLYYLANPTFAIMRQIIVSFILAIRDLKRYFKHLISKPIDLKEWQNSIVIVNATHDLPRQFNLSLLAAQSKEKYLIWNWETGTIETLENFLDKRETGKLNDESAARQTAPVSAFKLIKNYFAKSYCSPLSTKPDKELEKTYQLMKSPGLADEKLLNWRRIVYASRLIAKNCAVLKALKPKMIIASDSFDGSRAVSLVARKYGIPVLATAHSISMFRIPMEENFALADVHCLFSAVEGLMTFDGFPDLKSDYLVAHDNLKKIRTLSAKPKYSGKCRVFIITSKFSYGFINWTNEIFVKWADYDEMLRELMIKLAPYSDKIEIVIKSHPKYDNHPIYDRLLTEFPDLLVRNWREPIDLTKPLPADVVVVYNSNSTLTFAAFEQELPVLGFWGALTSLALDNVVINQLYGTDDVSQLVRMILDIAKSPDGETADKARIKAKQVYNRYVEPAQFGLAEAVEYTLNHRTEIE
ncbi:hypothetical protein BH20ACI1_BH20ACI1_21110 [soil metagenome]